MILLFVICTILFFIFSIAHNKLCKMEIEYSSDYIESINYPHMYISHKKINY